MTTLLRRFQRLLVLFLAIGATVVGQSTPDTTVEGRLLQILKERGVINDAEFAELSALELEIRERDDIETRLNASITEMVNRGSDEAPKTGYKLGKGFTWTTADGKFALSIGGRIQTRFTHEENEDPNKGGEGESNFDVTRNRLWFEGHAFEDYWRYAVQFDLAGDLARGTAGPLSVPGGGSTGTQAFSSSNRLVELKDAYIEFTKWKPFNIRGGQFKVPYSRHQLTSSGRQEFVDRAITDRTFAPARNHGLMFFGTAGGEKDDIFEYYLGAFNGEGENTVNNDDGLLWAGRLAVNPMGAVPYSETDVANSEDFKVALGVNAWFHDNDNHAASGARFDQWSVGLDFTMIYCGWFFTTELHYRENEQGSDDAEIVGWFGQLGYFLIPKEFEIAIRAAGIDWDNNSTLSGQREYLLVLGYYVAGHNLKLQADFGRVELHEHDHARNDDEWRLRLQAQIVF